MKRKDDTTMSSDFIFGFLLGLLFAAFFGYVVGQIRNAQRLARSPDRPQQVQMPTATTPRQVMGAAMRATFAIFGWVLVLMAGFWILVMLFILAESA
jgi:hypothetical protein